MTAALHFLHSLIFGRTTVARTVYFGFDYDRCRWGGWDYYAFYLGFFKVLVNAKK